MTSTSRTRVIGIFVFDGMEELDGVGPWEVFAWWTGHVPDDGWAATTFSVDGGPVTCEKTMVIQPHHSKASIPQLDVLLHPGGDGTVALHQDPDHLAWIRDQRQSVPLIASVCTGARVLAAAGLLRDRPATTNHTALDELARIDPSIRIRPAEERYVDDGDLITAGGIAAGLDMAMHIVERLVSVERAVQVSDGIEYPWKPTGISHS